MTGRFQTECPHCGKSLKTSAEMAGRTARCPGCQVKFEISAVRIAGRDSLLPSQDARSTQADGETAYRQGDIAASTPKQIGRFVIQRELGRGGFGRVFLCTDPLLDRQVALKVPRFETDDDARTERFLAEGKAAAHLRHPNLVAVFESGQTDDGQLYIVSEYVLGESLSQRIAANRPDLHQAATWIRDVAKGLAYAHGEGIVHRDIKPENIMIGSQGRPQIMDFGLAKRTDADSAMTTDGTIMGTPAYMSPEQARGDVQSVGPASDQYSLGATLYELLTGRRPFEGAPHVVISAVTSSEPPQPRSLNPAVPRDLEAICLKAMEKESARRFASIGDFASDLDRWLDGRPVLARPVPPWERGWRWCQRQPAIAGLAMAFVFTFAVGFSLTYWQWRRAVLSANETQSANTKLQNQQQNLIDAKNTAVQAAEKERIAADKERQATEKERQTAGTFRMQAYVAEINQAQHALEGGDVDLAINLLEKYIPQNGDPDLRDFEWHYLWRQCHLSTTLTERNPSDQGKRKSARALAFSADGRKLVASEHNLLHVWDVMTKQRIKTLKGHAQEIWSVVWHPDSTRLISGGGSATTPGELFIWDIESGRNEALPIEAKDVPDITQDVTSVALSRDGGTLFVATARMESEVESRGAPSSRYYDFAPSPGTVLIWDLATRKVIRSFHRDQGGAMSVAVSPDGRWLTCGGTDGRIAVWDTASPDKSPLMLSVHKQYVWNLRFSRDGRQLFSSAGHYMFGGELLWWDVATWTLKQSLDVHQKCVYALDIDPTGRWLCSGGYDRLLRIWDTKAQPTGSYAGWQWKWHFSGTGYGHSFIPSAVALAPYGRMLASSDWHGNVRLWRVHELRSTTDSADDSLMAQRKAVEQRIPRVTTAGEGSTRKVYYWQDANREPELLHTLTLPGATRSYAVSRDLSLVAFTTRSDDLLIYDVKTGKNVANIKLPTLASSVKFASHGRWLVVSGDDGRLRQFDTTSWKLIREFRGHTDVVSGIAVNPPATRLASISWDGTIRIWDATSGVQLLSLPRFGGYDANFSDDNRTLFTGGGVYDSTPEPFQPSP